MTLIHIQPVKRERRSDGDYEVLGSELINTNNIVRAYPTTVRGMPSVKTAFLVAGVDTGLRSILTEEPIPALFYLAEDFKAFAERIGAPFDDKVEISSGPIPGTERTPKEAPSQPSVRGGRRRIVRDDSLDF